MNTKYHLKRKNYIYDNSRLWFEGQDHIIEIFDDKNAAEEMLSRYNLSSYTDKHIYQFISTMDDQKVILEKLEEFLRLEFDISMRMHNSSSYEINFQLPAMSKEQYQRVHDIIGITWCVIEEVKPSGLFIIKSYYDAWDEEEMFWIIKKKFTTYQEAEDMVMYCILCALVNKDQIYGNARQLLGSHEEISTNVEALKKFLSKSKYFHYIEKSYDFDRGVYIKKPIKGIPRIIKAEFGGELEDWDILDFETDFKEECKNLIELLGANCYNIVQI